MANFKRHSRYTGGIVTKNRTDQDFLVLRNSLNLEEADGDIFIEVIQEYINRPDLLSHRVYGTPELWWVIFDFNEIQDPITQLKIGQLLRIPDIDRVLIAIDNINNIGL